MEISKRLQTIANYVPIGTDVVVDVGTDHGYIPIYLIKNKIANKCIACDVNPKPLSNAKRNISTYNMEDKIETRLSNGLSKIKVGEADVIIAAGMGGMLIIDILKENLAVVKASGLLILQAQLDIVEVRKYIHQIEFTIIDEKMVSEDGKYYTIIIAKPGNEPIYSDLEYMFGKKIIQAKDLVFKDFILYKIKQNELLEKSISNIQTQEVEKRLQEIKKQQVMYEEVLNCL